MLNDAMTVHQMIAPLRQEPPEARVEVTARRGKHELRGSTFVECVVYEDDQGTRTPLLGTAEVV